MAGVVLAEAAGLQEIERPAEVHAAGGGRFGAKFGEIIELDQRSRNNFV